eukprot:CAMPEP_0171751208 /NCGR_PEP_ID=MMETSP0991-20121206/41879_1 /TAXON_ID=483369 /ORGANISM="non described non described, Strain CCMP2098" /LENGTH=57 /DNA_ID=CAMNT_0012352347 /DNA_START=101 /DNA_END=271 /DNA_ORIENTATION=+
MPPNADYTGGHDGPIPPPLLSRVAQIQSVFGEFQQPCCIMPPNADYTGGHDGPIPPP